MHKWSVLCLGLLLGCWVTSHTCIWESSEDGGEACNSWRWIIHYLVVPIWRLNLHAPVGVGLCLSSQSWLTNLFEAPLKRSEALKAWAQGWLSTKIDEDGIRTLKMKARQSDNGTLSRQSRWAILKDSALLSDHGRPSVKVTNVDVANSIGCQTDPGTFMAESEHPPLSLPQDYFDAMTSEHGQGSYPKMKPETYHTSGLRWEAYLQAGGFPTLCKAWFSLLCVLGMLFREEEGGRNINWE